MKQVTKWKIKFVAMAIITNSVLILTITYVDFPEIGYSNVNFTVWDGHRDNGISWTEDSLFSVVIITEEENCPVNNPSPQKYFFQIESLDRNQLTDVRYSINLQPGRYIVHTRSVSDSSLVQSRRLTIEQDRG